MANYIKIKRVKLTWGHVAITVEENWILEKWDNIENIVRRVRKLGREIEGRIDEDNILENKMT